MAFSKKTFVRSLALPMRYNNLKKDMALHQSAKRQDFSAQVGAVFVKPLHKVSLTTRFKPKLVALAPY